MTDFIPAERFLPYLPWPEVEALPTGSLIVLPVASIEQQSGYRVLLFPKEREYFVQLMLAA